MMNLASIYASMGLRMVSERERQTRAVHFHPLVIPYDKALARLGSSLALT